MLPLRHGCTGTGQGAWISWQGVRFGTILHVCLRCDRRRQLEGGPGEAIGRGGRRRVRRGRCAKRLAKHGVDVTLIDRNNYHQFQPLLYQVATASSASPDIARPSGHVRQARHVRDAPARSPRSTRRRSVTLADGSTFTGDILVLAAGAKANFFHTPGARSTPSRSTRRRRRAAPLPAVRLMDSADRDPRSSTQGALNFVIVGGGPPEWRPPAPWPSWSRRHAALSTRISPTRGPRDPGRPGRARARRRSPTRRTATPPRARASAASSSARHRVTEVDRGPWCSPTAARSSPAR